MLFKGDREPNPHTLLAPIKSCEAPPKSPSFLFPPCSCLHSSYISIRQNLLQNMSSRRSRARQSGGSRISEDQIDDLVVRLQQLLPEVRRQSSDKVLQETCNYIRNLQKEVDGLSERLSELLATTDVNSPEAAVIRSLLSQ